MIMKKCKKCNIEKDFLEFNKSKNYQDGMYIYCKKCKRESSKKYYNNNRNRVISKVKKYRDENLDKVCEGVRKYYNNNRDELIQYRRTYYSDNKEILLINNKKYYEKNKLDINIKKKEYIREQRKDPLFKLKESVSSLINGSIKKAGIIKKYRSQIILGCDLEYFKEYLESKFKDGMNWENKGEWHLDHIIPISWATNAEEIIKLNHFTNFQPLWEKENLSKGNRTMG